MTEENLDALQVSWVKLIEQEEAFFGHVVDLDTHNEKTEEKSAALRKWWSAVSELVWIFVKTRAEQNYELQPPPLFCWGDWQISHRSSAAE